MRNFLWIQLLVPHSENVSSHKKFQEFLLHTEQNSHTLVAMATSVCDSLIKGIIRRLMAVTTSHTKSHFLATDLVQLH